MRRLRGERLIVTCVLLLVFTTGCDWLTWGDGPERQGRNPYERTIGVNNVANLRQAWSTPLGGVSDTAPLVAAVDFAGTAEDVAYVGTEHGAFFAIRVSDGSVVWSRQFPTVTLPCDYASPDHVIGITGSAVIDKEKNLVYFGTVDGKVQALDLATGQEAAGWPVQYTSDPAHDFVWGALTIWGERLYVSTDTRCEGEAPYEGKIVAIDRNTRAVARTFSFTPAGSGRGGGVWGWGGVSVDPANGDVFAASGNAINGDESFGYSDSIVRLTGDLNPVAAHKPPVFGFDDDFGSTPVLFQRCGCPPQLAAERKDGTLSVYNRDAIAAGPMQTVPVSGYPYNFIGLPAFDGETNMLYVTNPTKRVPDGNFVHGMLAFKLQPDCMLSLRWQTTAGQDGNVVSTPTIANGVVYYGDGPNRKIHAFNALTGAELWSSGADVTGEAYAAPVVVNGTLLAATWDGRLHAWRP